MRSCFLHPSFYVMSHQVRLAPNNLSWILNHVYRAREELYHQKCSWFLGFGLTLCIHLILKEDLLRLLPGYIFTVADGRSMLSPSRLCIVRTGMAGPLYWKPVRPVWSCRSLLERTTSLRSKLWPKGAMAPAAVPSAYQRCPVSFHTLRSMQMIRVGIKQMSSGMGALRVTNPLCDWYCLSASLWLEQGLQNTHINCNKTAA